LCTKTAKAINHAADTFAGYSLTVPVNKFHHAQEIFSLISHFCGLLIPILMKG